MNVQCARSTGSHNRMPRASSRARHVPGAQPPFPLIPDPDQNKEATSFISVVAYDIYIPLSRPIQFCLLPNQNFEKNAQDPGDPTKPRIQDPSGFLPIFMGFKPLHQRNSVI